MTDENRSRTTGAPGGKNTAPRLRYERPVLRHLGSVNRLTLAVSNLSGSDGSKTKRKGV